MALPTASEIGARISAGAASTLAGDIVWTYRTVRWGRCSVLLPWVHRALLWRP